MESIKRKRKREIEQGTSLTDVDVDLVYLPNVKEKHLDFSEMKDESEGDFTFVLRETFVSLTNEKHLM